LKNKHQEKQKNESMNLQQILAGNFSLTSRIFGKSKDETLASLEKQINDVRI